VTAAASRTTILKNSANLSTAINPFATTTLVAMNGRSASAVAPSTTRLTQASGAAFARFPNATSTIRSTSAPAVSTSSGRM
jgi:hypothetical protein